MMAKLLITLCFFALLGGCTIEPWVKPYER